VKKLFEFFNLIHIHKYLIPLNIIFWNPIMTFGAHGVYRPIFF
jgi:hypothetical protein